MSTASTASCTRRAIGIVRVSQTGGRAGESFVSPAEQRDRVAAACERDGLVLVETIKELDVSGGTALERRPGLRCAVEAIEAGEADVMVAAYFAGSCARCACRTSWSPALSARVGGCSPSTAGA